jgi:GrpB-like predicted nucleotidyltransferase (UPF0157 family)
VSKAPHSRIAVVPYDPCWPLDFERAAGEVITALAANLLAIHHIGSTSIPGIHAKPVIDILAVVLDLRAVDERTDAIRSLGYQVMGEFGIAGRRYFRRDDSTGRANPALNKRADTVTRILTRGSAQKHARSAQTDDCWDLATIVMTVLVSPRSTGKELRKALNGKSRTR